MKRTLKKSLATLFLLVAAASLALSACGSGAQTPSAAPPTTAQPGTSDNSDAIADTGEKEIFVLHTSTKKECTSTPYVVGEAKGIFEKYGIKIEYTGEISSAAEALTAVINGTNDFEGTLPNALATYASEGAPIKAVTYLQTDPPESQDGIDDISKFRHMRFYVRADSPLNSIEDIANFQGSGTDGNITISGRAPSCNSFIPSAALRNHGVDPSRLEYVSFNGTTEILQAIDLGNLDIAGIHPPFYKLAEDSGYKLIFDSHDTGLGQASGAETIYFTEDFIAEHPEEIQAFVSAIKEAANWTLDNIDEAIELTAAYIGQDISAVHWYYGEPGFPAEYIQPWIDDLILNGALEEGQVTLEQITTTQFG
ncbi:MAG: ABC transporter substrate-binding protein [Oscillospiraceae bacterium]|jgi:ABC-type nitrate/sulfonate/bicarbonate transport system substrate-binding protein|nr:ABC transporter substrate-binding protein [Oscillospiraceae bacterium]